MLLCSDSLHPQPEPPFPSLAVGPSSLRWACPHHPWHLGAAGLPSLSAGAICNVFSLKLNHKEARLVREALCHFFCFSHTNKTKGVSQVHVLWKFTTLLYTHYGAFFPNSGTLAGELFKKLTCCTEHLNYTYVSPLTRINTGIRQSQMEIFSSTLCV